MFAGERPTVDGRWYKVADAINEPRPLSRIPILIGGSGEKKTLRLVAQYADESNMTCPPAEVPRKLDALAQHCEALGRDRSEIIVSLQGNSCIAPTHDEAVAEVDAYFARRGMDLSSMGADDAAAMRAIVVHGDPDEVGEVFSERLALGVDGFTVNAVANGHIEGRVSLLGETLRKVAADRTARAPGQALSARCAGMRCWSEIDPSTPSAEATSGMSHTATSECCMTTPPNVFARPMLPWKTIAERPK